MTEEPTVRAVVYVHCEPCKLTYKLFCELPSLEYEEFAKFILTHQPTVHPHPVRVSIHHETRLRRERWEGHSEI